MVTVVSIFKIYKSFKMIVGRKSFDVPLRHNLKLPVPYFCFTFLTRVLYNTYIELQYSQMASAMDTSEQQIRLGTQTSTSTGSTQSGDGEPSTMVVGLATSMSGHSQHIQGPPELVTGLNNTPRSDSLCKKKY